jgi:hypothetical protein
VHGQRGDACRATADLKVDTVAIGDLEHPGLEWLHRRVQLTMCSHDLNRIYSRSDQEVVLEAV